jgi:hypothetical protein
MVRGRDRGPGQPLAQPDSATFSFHGAGAAAGAGRGPSPVLLSKGGVSPKTSRARRPANLALRHRRLWKRLTGGSGAEGRGTRGRARLGRRGAGPGKEGYYAEAVECRALPHHEPLAWAAED